MTNSSVLVASDVNRSYQQAEETPSCSVRPESND